MSEVGQSHIYGVHDRVLGEFPAKNTVYTLLVYKCLYVHIYMLLANPILANPIQANPIPSNPILAKPIPANPIPANPIQAKPTQANPILANPTPKVCTALYTYACHV
jgi:hypothetical protein